MFWNPWQAARPPYSKFTLKVLEGDPALAFGVEESMANTGQLGLKSLPVGILLYLHLQKVKFNTLEGYMSVSDNLIAG